MQNKKLQEERNKELQADINKVESETAETEKVATD